MKFPAQLIGLWFEPESSLRLVSEHRVQIAPVVPSMLYMLLAQPLEEYDLSALRYVACGAAPPFRGKSEALWQETTAYQHFAVVDYNAEPVVPGAGSAVFIHDDTGRPTIGCVSVAPSSLLRLLQWLNRSRKQLMTVWGCVLNWSRSRTRR